MMGVFFLHMQFSACQGIIQEICQIAGTSYDENHDCRFTRWNRSDDKEIGQHDRGEGRFPEMDGRCILQQPPEVRIYLIEMESSFDYYT